MKITKFGHCCMLIEENGIRILTDPGSYTTEQSEVKDIDIVLITHEHADHFHIESLKKCLQNNPKAKIITNTAVAALLEKEGIPSIIVNGDSNTLEKEILIEGFGKDHATIYPTVPVVQNVGYLINNKFYYPGDSLTNPNKPVQILAFPVAGPWVKISEAIDFALAIKADVSIPVHDGILKDPTLGSGMPGRILPEKGLRFEVLELGKEYEF